MTNSFSEVAPVPEAAGVPPSTTATEASEAIETTQGFLAIKHNESFSL